MFPPFPEEEAFLECKKIIYDLESKVLTLEQITPESESRKAQGIMIGVLIAEDDKKNRVVLKPFLNSQSVLHTKLKICKKKTKAFLFRLL